MVGHSANFYKDRPQTLDDSTDILMEACQVIVYYVGGLSFGVENNM